MSLTATAPDFASAYGDIAAGALAYPMAPQLLTEAELQAIAGSIQGWELIAGVIDPAMAYWSARYGGGLADGTLKLKLQSWFRNWIQPPKHYNVHIPRVANGAWYRLFRTSMRVPERIQEATRNMANLSEEEVVARYAHLLGHGARARYGEDGFDRWCADVLTCIQQGEWHLAVYSPQWEAFISPVVDEPRSNDLIERCLAEFPAVNPQLYPVSESNGASWNLAEAIRAGALVEVYGDRLDAPSFGDWGNGVLTAEVGPNSSRRISGFIHTRPDRTQAVPVQGGDMGSVVVDAPNMGSLLQDIYSVTGWRAPGFSQAALLGQDEDALCQEVLVVTQNHSLALEIPGKTFREAMATSPQIVPVYGRLVSTFTHVALDWRHSGDGSLSPFGQ